MSEIQTYDKPGSLKTVDEVLNKYVPLNVFRPIFNYKDFNAMQSVIAESVLRSNDNMTVASPTGSGKTTIFELAIVKMFNDDRNRFQSASLSKDKINPKAIYLAPSKSLVQERIASWKHKFGSSLNKKVVELTSDSLETEGDNFMDLIREADIICSTAEKFDSCTTKWRGDKLAKNLVFNLQLILLDKLPRVTLHVDGRPNCNDIRKEFINNDELSDEWEFIYNVKTEHVEKEATKVIHRVLRSKRNGRLYALFNSRVQKCNFDSVKDNTNGFGGIFYAYEIYKSDDDGKYYSEKAFCSKYKQIYEEKLYIVKLMNLDDIEKSRKIMQAKSTHQANASNDDPENTPPFAANEEDPWNEIAINILLKKCPHENIIKMEQYGIIGKIFDDPSEFSDGNVVNLNVTNIEQNYLFMILECAEVGDAFSSKISNIKRSEKLCEIFVHILKAVKQ